MERRIIDLIQLKERLRKEPRAAHVALHIAANDIAEGYHHLRRHAPSRSQGYLSSSRNGVAPLESSGRRREERLAMALFNRGAIEFDSGDRLRLLDYQFPLKSVRSDSGIGKIDLLGLFGDGTFAIVELKVDGNTEDRRIALLEGLIYAAIVEANSQTIAAEVHVKHGLEVSAARPRVLVVAPEAFWSNSKGHPSLAEISKLARDVNVSIPIELSLLTLHGAESFELGLGGTAPQVANGIRVSPVNG